LPIFYSATDADSEGEEGKYFVWTPAEVARVVDTNDVDLVCRYWDISDQGNLEGKSIPHVPLTVEQGARMFGRSPGDAAAALERARVRLLAARGERVPPARDEKILTGWNGLMIGTLAEAGRVLRAARFVEAACAAAEFVWTRLRAGGKLLHGWAGGRAKHGAYLDDHAFLASAPHVLLRLHHLAGEAGPRAHAEEILRLYHDEAAENPFGHATYLQALELYLEGPVEVVVVGRRGAADTDVLWGQVARAYLPHRVLVATQSGEPDLPLPARERPAVGGQATAYVCRNFTCSAPVTRADELARLLQPGA